MRFRLLVLLVTAAVSVAGVAHAVYFVRISDLQYPLKPPNPIRIAGTVVCDSPCIVNDGSAALMLSSASQAKTGDFAVVTGNWSQTGMLTSATASVLLDSRPEMLYIPPSTFSMGSTFYQDSTPVHTVAVSEFWIWKTEVTRGDYRKFIDAGAYNNPAYWSTDGWVWRLANFDHMQPTFWDAQQNWGAPFTQTDSFPVVGVTFYEAEAYCKWAGGSLPTEAQWERAAAAAFQAPYDQAYGADLNYAGTTPVGYYTDYYWEFPGRPINGLPGMADTLGNASEWCSDWYQSDYYSQSPAGGWTDPTGPVSGTNKVTRGGSWNSRGYSANFMAAGRYPVRPDTISSLDLMTTGFRIVKQRPVVNGGLNVIGTTGSAAGTWQFTLYNSNPNGWIPTGLDIEWGDGPSPDSYILTALGSPDGWPADYFYGPLFPSWSFDSVSGTPLAKGQSLGGFTVTSATMPTNYTVHLKDASGNELPEVTGTVIYLVR